ncbi:MAG: cytochrome P450 [Acidimicrobiales bacterium mtb01]|nr:cytochrome P450 [Actinomycetota bacterium]TEX44810.1 MAG: cytochrome P450 [Acidimicrobiales bacterium mtb01]
MNTIALSTYADAREAYRHKALQQALYDEGQRLMSGVIVNLHGQAHLDRRRLENRLFRRDVFAWFEAERIPEIIGSVLDRTIAAGRADLLPLARRTMMTLSIAVAGVDRVVGDDDELDEIYALMDRLARASTVAHALGDKAAIVEDGDRALDEFRDRFYLASLERRRRLIASFDDGAIGEDELPRDVLTTLLRNQDRLELPADIVLREIAYFPWVGSHSTSNQLVHAMHHVFEWIEARPNDRERLLTDRILLQRFVHESLRLHPASPVSLRHALEDIALKSGVAIPRGSLVAIELEKANRDALVWGDRADEFDPFRPLADGVMPWGLTFGHGLHACLGQELAGGLECPAHVAVGDGADPGDHLFGSIAVMAHAILVAGARRDPADPPHRDESTTRQVWGRYPVIFQH